MNLDLDPASAVPIYLQIIEQVRRLIALGALKPGDQLATVRDLAVQCRVNRNTVARAVQELERDGIVRTRVGQGTFVSDEAPGFDPEARDAILDGQIDRLLVEASSLGVPLEQIPTRLWRQIEAFRKEGAGGSGAGSGSERREGSKRPSRGAGGMQERSRPAPAPGGVPDARFPRGDDRARSSSGNDTRTRSSRPGEDRDTVGEGQGDKS